MQTLRNRIAPIQVLATQLNTGSDFRIDLPFVASKIVLPPYFSPLGNGVSANPGVDSGSRLGVKINDPNSAILVFGNDASSICEYVGQVQTIYVRYLSGPSQPWYLLALDGVDVKFSGQVLGGFAGGQ